MPTNPQVREKLPMWQKPYLHLASALCASLTIAFGVSSYLGWGAAQVDTLLKGNRGQVYGALSAVFGSLLGFTITAVSVVLVLWGDARMTLAREANVDDQMWAVFTKSIFALSGATVTALTALVVDRDGSPSWPAMVLAFGFSLLAVSRVFACVWLFEKLVAVVKGPGDRGTGASA